VITTDAERCIDPITVLYRSCSGCEIQRWEFWC